MKVSVIIPCYNEENTISKIVEKINLQSDIEKEIIVLMIFQQTEQEKN